MMENIADVLLEKITTYSDPESAVAIYLEIAALEKRLAEIKGIARRRVETYMQNTGEVVFKCQAGKAAYTKPKTAKLDKRAWESAVLRDPALAQLQHKYDLAADKLSIGQETFKVLPDPSLRITG